MSAEENAGTSSEVEIKEEYKRFIGRKTFFISSLLVSILILIGIASTLGPIDISVLEVYATILDKLFPNYFDVPELATIVVWNIRLPRILMGIVAGVGLAIAGTVMQGILRNPLASPYTLGISAGAGFGAAIAIILGAGFVGGEYLVVGNAFIFALLCSFVILGLSSRRGATPETMILAGIAMMYLFSACTTLLQYFADPDAVKEVVFWMVGSLGKATWSKLYTISIVLAVSIPLLMWKSWDLNVMGAGDETAKSLGVNAQRTRVFMMVIASLLTASIVCFTGTIGFIGLVAPHMCRMVIGGDNRFVFPASALSGGLLLAAADVVAMQIIAPVIIPIGVMTAFMGVPLFFYLIMRRRREYW
jgi:iron complex transport system permease protein